MNKKYIYIIIAIVAIVVLIFVFTSPKNKKNIPQQQETAETKQEPVVSKSYKDISYVIDDETITLVNGSAEAGTAPGSISQIETDYFGKEATGDLDGDSKPDVAFLLTQSGGGTGTFYYVVVALKTDAGYEGTNGVAIGDRIVPKSTQVKNGQIIVTYLDRKPDDPMVAEPTVETTKYFKIEDGELVEVE